MKMLNFLKKLFFYFLCTYSYSQAMESLPRHLSPALIRTFSLKELISGAQYKLFEAQNIKTLNQIQRQFLTNQTALDHNSKIEKMTNKTLQELSLLLSDYQKQLK